MTQNSQASIRKEFNYQGKLTNNAGVNVVDGAYDVVFKIYTQAGGGTAAWTESWTAAALFTEATTTMTNDGCATGVDKIAYTTGTNESSLKAGQTLWNTTTKQSAVIESVVAASNYICIYDPQAAWTSGNQVTNRIYIKNGLFSAMVGSVTNQTIQFTGSTYYLGVTVGADSEMIPRKKIGSVPQAWNANSLQGDGAIDIDNTSTSQDAANINYNPASGAYSALSVVYGSGGGTGTALSVSQAGTGNIVDFKDGVTSVFTISDGGNITMNALSFTQNAVNPVHKGAITDDGTTELDGAMSIYVSGKYAYVASADDDGVEILDISNPASPTHVGAITDDGTTELVEAHSIYVSGKYAYVANCVAGGVEILDISNPTSPTHVGAITDDGTTELAGAMSIYVSGKYAYVTSYADDGVEILDLAGFDIPTANIGDLNVSTLDVTDNASVANNLYVGNGLNVGPGGVYSTGPMSTYVNSTATALTVSQSGTGPLMDILDTGVSIFRVGQATVEITRPLDLQVEGDVGVEYNLSFLNNASSYINSAGPLIISAGDTNSYENLTLTTSGTGDVVIDIASSVLGLKVVGLAGQVFSIDPSGNVTIGGTDSGDGNLTVKGNISTQGGNLDLNSLATPAGIVVTPTGTAGATTYGYRISAINDNGQTLAAATATTTTGNAALSATNYNRISWGVVPGATGYKVYGRTSGFELLMTTINSPTLMYDDTGAATPSGALPTTNTTGGNNITYAAADGPKRSIILTAAGAEVPATGGPAQTKIAGTNHTYYVLDFDAATDESAYWHWTMPDSYDGGKIDITYYWEAAATSAEVGWCFQAVGIAPNNAEDIDVALSAASLANCAIDTAQGNANDLASIASTQVVSNFSAGEYVAFKVFRDADGSTVGAGNDDMTGDARLVKVKIEYSVNAESD